MTATPFNPAAGPACIFLMGVPDTKTVTVSGFGPGGQVEYDWDGNTDFLNFTRTPPQNRMIMPVLWFANEAHEIPAPDIFVNCISDADGMSQSLLKAAQFMDAAQARWPDIPVFNPPRRVMETRRDLVYERFHRLPGLHIPRTVRFRPQDRADVVGTARREGFSFPVIVRPCGSHNGNHMVLLESPERAAALDRLAFDGTFFYMTQFTDYSCARGIFNKERFIIAGGNMYPRHRYAHGRWKLSTGFRQEVMKGDAALCAEERAFLESFPSRMSAAARDSALRIYDETGLDYLGFDCSTRPDGSLLVFEINAAVSAMDRADALDFPYAAPFIDAITRGYNDALARRIGAGRASRKKAAGGRA